MGDMLERAVAAMKAAPNRRAWSLEDLRKAAGISMRSRYRLANQLRDDDRVAGGRCNVFCLPEWAS